jgi:pilus assembly protein CpaB
MNTNRLLIGLAVAVVIAFLLSTFVYKQFKKATTTVATTPTQTLVVATRPLPLGTRLDDSNVHLIPWPADQPVAGMYTRVQDIVNRAVITDLAANEPILESKLAPIQSGGGLPATIPEGMRAISVAVNEVIGVAGFVTPGTMVDVLVTGRLLNGPANMNTNITKTLLENVKVLAAGQKIEQDREGKPQSVPVITLLVTPEDAAILAMGSTQGKIQLALRNTIDTKKTDPAPILEAALFSSNALNPPKPTVGKRSGPSIPPAYVVEIINGNKRENKSFPNAR